MRGGYQILDLKNKNITTGVGMVFDGIYDTIEGTQKAVLVSGLQLDETEYKDTYIQLHVEGSSYLGTIYGKNINIQDTDVVTITEA